LRSWVMQYEVREIRGQKIVERGVQCFKCREEKHKKWECLKIKEKKKEVGRSTTTRGIEKGEGALWSIGTAFKRNSNEYWRIDNMVGNGDLCRV